MRAAHGARDEESSEADPRAAAVRSMNDERLPWRWPFARVVSLDLEDHRIRVGAGDRMGGDSQLGHGHRSPDPFASER